MKVTERKFAPSTALQLMKQGIHPVLSRVLAARGVKVKEDAALTLPSLRPYSELLGAQEMASILADAIEQKKRLLIVADYDADGATACTLGMRGLRAFGANVEYIIPNRLEHGYGLTPSIVEIACDAPYSPDFLITVDNGISSHEGIDLANSLGVPVLVTDHHLQGDTLPNARIIVNPNQRGCSFPSKALAGCGVMYYVLWALQDELWSRSYPGIAPGFDVTSLLPIVAIGTVADVVALDTNNRILVNEGLKRIREGAAQPGIAALAKVSGKSLEVLSTSDIAFGIGPRINAAGRLESMDAGVDCLLTDSLEDAQTRAAQLHDINNRRKEIELDMTDEAIRHLLTEISPNRVTAVLHSSSWHQGVIGVVAGRIKEKLWRPTFVLADGKEGELKGSGRSIPGLHLRDALDLVNTRNPGILSKFGGHAMAAGVTVYANKLAEFSEAFEAVVQELINPADLLQVLEVDGSLSFAELNLETVRFLKNQVWGQCFTEPLFMDEFFVVEARLIGGGKHLKMTLEKGGARYQAVKFRYSDAPPQGTVLLAYKVDSNTYRDETNLQLLVEHIL